MKEAMKETVLGLLFSTEQTHVVLTSIDSVWCGIQGDFLPDETPLAAMQRNFIDVAGVFVQDWQKFAELNTESEKVHVFKAFHNKLFPAECNIFYLPIAEAGRGFKIDANLPNLITKALLMV